MKAKYLQNLAYIRNKDPYVLNTSDLCKDVSRWVDICADGSTVQRTSA